EIGLEHLERIADGPAARVHELRPCKRAGTETAIEIGVLGRERADGARVKLAFPILFDHARERLHASSRGAKRAVVALRIIHDPARQLRMVELVGDIVGKQGSSEERLGRDMELPAAMGHCAGEFQLARYLPNELLEEFEEELVIEPRERYRLDREFERL